MSVHMSIPTTAPHAGARDRYTAEQLAELDRLFAPLPGFVNSAEIGDLYASAQAYQGWQNYQAATERFRLENESRPVAPFVPGNRSAFRRGRRSGRDSLRIPLASSSSSSSSPASARADYTGLNIPL